MLKFLKERWLETFVGIIILLNVGWAAFGYYDLSRLIAWVIAFMYFVGWLVTDNWRRQLSAEVETMYRVWIRHLEKLKRTSEAPK